MKELLGNWMRCVFGSLAQRGELTRKTIHRFLDSVKSDCLKVCDINLRIAGYSPEVIRSSLQKADVLKLSDEEIKIVADMVGVDSTSEAADIIKDFIAKYDFKAVLYTLGKDGADIYIDGKSCSYKPDPIKPVSTVGAGDSFTARAVVGLLNREDPQSLIENACKVAAYVCMQEGAMPKLPDSFRVVE